MTGKELFLAAHRSTVDHASSVSERVRVKLELAYVAQWLFDQDESSLQRATLTARDAIARIHEHSNRG